MNSKHKRSWSGQEKLSILEEARQAGARVSDVCRRHQLAPAQFYLWEKQARQGALEAQRPGPRGRKAPSREAILELENTRLQVALGELALENLRLKKGQ